MNIKAEVALTLNISLEVRHFEVIVDPIHHKVWEPWVFSACLEQLVE